jgi:signal transduction histidine kinase
LSRVVALREVDAAAPQLPGGAEATASNDASAPAPPDVAGAILSRAFEDFSASASRLGAQFASLRAEVRTLAAELEEKNRIIEALERQAARNERIAAMGEMAQRIAHQIRNPLGTIDLYASMLSQDLREHPGRVLAERIATSVRACDLVVDNLLAFADDMDPVRAPCDLRELVVEVADSATRLLSARRIQIELAPLPELERVGVDRDLVRQAILNLVLNAAQAGADDAIVRVEVERRLLGEAGEAWLTVRVVDRGAGVAAADLERIFDPLYSTRRGGAGIGLAIVQRVAETHGGVVEVASEEGRGSTFSFSLPLAATA